MENKMKPIEKSSEFSAKCLYCDCRKYENKKEGKKSQYYRCRFDKNKEMFDEFCTIIDSRNCSL